MVPGVALVVGTIGGDNMSVYDKRDTYRGFTYKGINETPIPPHSKPTRSETKGSTDRSVVLESTKEDKQP